MARLVAHSQVRYMWQNKRRGRHPGISGFGAPVFTTIREVELETEVDRDESASKTEYLPPILVDYGLLAKEAAAASGSGSDGGVYS